MVFGQPMVCTECVQWLFRSLFLHNKAQVCSCFGLEIQHACVLNHSESHLTQRKILMPLPVPVFLWFAYLEMSFNVWLERRFQTNSCIWQQQFLRKLRTLWTLACRVLPTAFPTAWPIGSHLCLRGGEVRFNCHMPTMHVLVHVRFVAR